VLNIVRSHCEIRWLMDRWGTKRVDSMLLQFHQMTQRRLENITIKFISSMSERTCLIIVAKEDIVDPICVNLGGLSKLRRLVRDKVC
jgi:hypothetical protein